MLAELCGKAQSVKKTNSGRILAEHPGKSEPSGKFLKLEECCSPSWNVEAFKSLASRIECEAEQKALLALQHEVQKVLGGVSIDPELGVYNPARLLRFLHGAHLDVADSRVSLG